MEEMEIAFPMHQEYVEQHGVKSETNHSCSSCKEGPGPNKLYIHIQVAIRMKRITKMLQLKPACMTKHGLRISKVFDMPRVAGFPEAK